MVFTYTSTYMFTLPCANGKTCEYFQVICIVPLDKEITNIIGTNVGPRSVSSVSMHLYKVEKSEKTDTRLPMLFLHDVLQENIEKVCSKLNKIMPSKVTFM